MRRRTALFLAAIPFLLVLGWAAAGTALAGGGCHGEDEATTTEASRSPSQAPHQLNELFAMT